MCKISSKKMDKVNKILKESGKRTDTIKKEGGNLVDGVKSEINYLNSIDTTDLSETQKARIKSVKAQIKQKGIEEHRRRFKPAKVQTQKDLTDAKRMNDETLASYKAGISNIDKARDVHNSLERDKLNELKHGFERDVKEVNNKQNEVTEEQIKSDEVFDKQEEELMSIK